MHKKLELHHVRLVVLRQCELGSHVGAQQLHLVDVGLELGVHSGLGSLALGGGDGGLGGGTSLEQGLLALLLVGSLSLEHSVVDLGHVNAVQGHLGGGGNDVLLVHAAKGNTVDGVGACDKQQNEGDE